jgi:hypothetical protein
VADIDLHRFKEDLDKVPPKGSNQPPRSISATNLDENFNKVTVLPSEADPPEYEIEYREDGVLLSRFLPEGEAVGNILYWNGVAWVVTAQPRNRGDLMFWSGTAWQALPAPQDNTLRVLAIQNGTLAWTATQDC